MFLTDILFSSPRLRFSEAQKIAVLNWAKQMGALDVPSLWAVKQCQQRILDLVGDPTEKVISKSETIFYQNDIGKAVAMVSRIYLHIIRCLQVTRIMPILSLVAQCKISLYYATAGNQHQRHGTPRRC